MRTQIPSPIEQVPETGLSEKGQEGVAQRRTKPKGPVWTSGDDVF